jgi:uncharacterized Zn finger protein (UPF0148 family)
MDVWAHCQECDRWFYPGKEPEGGTACPVCGANPVQIEDRDGPTAEQPGVQDVRQSGAEQPGVQALRLPGAEPAA